MREIADRRTLARSQDAVVELAVDRLYDEIQGQEEAALWEAAAEDPEFRAESVTIAALYRDQETWPA